MFHCFSCHYPCSYIICRVHISLRAVLFSNCIWTRSSLEYTTAHHFGNTMASNWNSKSLLWKKKREKWRTPYWCTYCSLLVFNLLVDICINNIDNNNNEVFYVGFVFVQYCEMLNNGKIRWLDFRSWLSALNKLPIFFMKNDTVLLSADFVFHVHSMAQWEEGNVSAQCLKHRRKMCIDLGEGWFTEPQTLDLLYLENSQKDCRNWNWLHGT